jgi:hypothetical protein
MLVVELFHGFDRINISNCLVMADPDDARESKRVPTCMTVALLYSVESDFNNHDGLYEAESTEVLNGVLFKEFGHLCDFEVS